MILHKKKSFRWSQNFYNHTNKSLSPQVLKKTIHSLYNKNDIKFKNRANRRQTSIKLINNKKKTDMTPCAY